MKKLTAFFAVFLFTLSATASGCFLLPQGVASSSLDNQQASTGKVLGLDGKPAANVLVRGYLVSNNASTLVSNNGASLVSNHAAGYRIAAEQLETRTDKDGKFSLKASNGAVLNIEACLSDEVKAMQLNVSASTSGLQMQLAYTGAISGMVTALDRPEVTNLQGVDVYVPGTSYMAKTDQGGHFTISNVAVGTFSLAGSKTGLGTAAVAGIAVESKTTTTAPELKLSLSIPTLIQAVPANAGPGATVILSGTNFGTSSGDSLQVLFSGTPATQVERLDDNTLKAVVPTGAETGELVVTVGGTSSTGYPFTVLKSLRLDPGNAVLTPGETLPLSVFALDTRGDVVSNPAISWSVNGTSVSLSHGIVSAGTVGESYLKVSSGRVSSLRKLAVVARYPTVSVFAGSGVEGYLEGVGAAAQFHFSSSTGLLLNADGNLLAADAGNNRIRLVTIPDGMVTTFAGDGTDALQDGNLATAKMRSPSVLARDPLTEDLYVADFQDVIRKITPSGQVTTFAGSGVSGYLDGPAASARFSSIGGMVVDDRHNVFLTDTVNHCIRKITQDGEVSTFAGTIQAGNFDGLRRTARFDNPVGIVWDGKGAFYISDSFNLNIRKMTSDGMVTTLAGSGESGYYDGNGQEAAFKFPFGLALDKASRLYVADSRNHCIRVITPDGMVSTLAGSGVSGEQNGAAPTAQFHYPDYLAVDDAGTVYVIEFWKNRIRKIQP